MVDPVDPKHWFTTRDPVRQFKNQVVRLADLIGTDPVLQSIRFENCRLLGPAILTLQENTEMVDSFIHGSWEHLIWEIPETREAAVGVFILLNCEIVRCELSMIGFAVPVNTQMVDYMKGLTSLPRPLPGRPQ